MSRPSTTQPGPAAGTPRRRTRRVYLLRRALVGGLAVGLAAAAVGLAWDVGGSTARATAGADPTQPGSRRTSTTSTTTTSTTTTTVPPTTAPTTTVPPTTVPPPPPLAVAPLDPGTGPVPVVHRLQTTDPVVFLTVDDGIVKDPWVLLLAQVRSVPLTMFLTQRYVPSGVDYFRQFLPLGGTVQSHTITHTKLRGLPEDVQRNEICAPLGPYTEWFGATPTLFRPPYGEYDDATLRAAASCGIRAVVHWNAVVENGIVSTTSGGPLAAGDIVLFHFQPDLAGNLSMVLDQLSLLGLRPAPLDQYLAAALAQPAPAPAPAPAPTEPTPAPAPAAPAPV